MKVCTAISLVCSIANSLRVAEIIYNAVDIECEFVSEALSVNLIGMNSDMMKQYIKFCADRLLLDKIILIMISIQGKTNFFEKNVSEYSKSGVGVDANQQIIYFNEDF